MSLEEITSIDIPRELPKKLKSRSPNSLTRSSPSAFQNKSPKSTPKQSSGRRRAKQDEDILPLSASQELKRKVVGPNDFEKIKMIGRGGVGRVYLVRHKETNELYAMKMLSKEDMIKRGKVDRAFTERQVLATADHPFIVQLHWSFQTPEYLYFIMDYCAGGEFYQVLQKHKRFPEEAVKFYASEVLLALEYLHMLGFVYRDLKPENILVIASGHLKLTDFDLSKQSATRVNPVMVKKMFSDMKIGTKPDLVSNSFVGTEEYLAPEVIQGYGHSSSLDWWTFGILIYEMLFGHTPFKGKTKQNTFDKILGQSVKFPDSPAVSKECKDLIKRLLNSDPKKRLGSESGAADVKEHKWFKSINWALIRNQTPPYIPPEEDLSKLKPSRLQDDVSDAEWTTEAETEDEDSPFAEFNALERAGPKLVETVADESDDHSEHADDDYDHLAKQRRREKLEKAKSKHKSKKAKAKKIDSQSHSHSSHSHSHSNSSSNSKSKSKSSKSRSPPLSPARLTSSSDHSGEDVAKIRIKSSDTESE